MGNKEKIFLAIISGIGVAMILIATHPYGAGLSPDSVGYIAIARNMILRHGFVSYDGVPSVVWPPLYPALLAFTATIFNKDPLLVASIANAVIFGLIIYFGGLLFSSYFVSSTSFGLLGTLFICFSMPLLNVSIMAWSETLFILFAVLSLLAGNLYCEKQDKRSLVYFSLLIAFSCLTRYIGVSLILFGAIVILLSRDSNIKGKFADLSLFVLLSSFPLSVWLLRNYWISNSLFGERTSSAFTLTQNFDFALRTLLHWYVPDRLMGYYLVLAIVIAIFLLVLIVRPKGFRLTVKILPRKQRILAAFVLTYTMFLIFSSTITAYDRIDDRLLSPVFVPVTLLLLILVKAIAESLLTHNLVRCAKPFMMVALFVLLLHPVRTNIATTLDVARNGRGYHSNVWVDGELISYLGQYWASEFDCSPYSNDPWAVYILLNLQAKEIPRMPIESFSNTALDSWQEESNACLIWFSAVHRENPSINDLRTVLSLDQIVSFKDGAIYTITKKGYENSIEK